MPLTTILALALLAGPLLGASAPPRGRDPWVFRLILEQKTRMVVLALREGEWAAYNPANGSLYKVWSGDLEYHGKVFDFGQECSWARGAVRFIEDDWLCVADDTEAVPPGWTAEGVRPTPDGWVFEGEGARLTSPPYDLREHDHVVLSFDERSRRGPLLVEVSADGGRTWAAQSFRSTTHISSDDAWQRNAKLIEPHDRDIRFRFTQLDAAHGKAIRRVMLQGDRRVWTHDRVGRPEHAAVDWRGYTIAGGTEAVTLRFDLRLAGGEIVRVEETPELEERDGELQLRRRISVHDVPEGVTVELALGGRDGAAWRHEGDGDLEGRGRAARIRWSADGTATLRLPWGEGAAP